MAAVLAGGPGTVLSHVSAAYLWRMLDPKPGPIHITVPTPGGRARRKGLVVHRATLLPGQTMHRARIPVTRPERTLSDLRRAVTSHEYRQALRQAEFDGCDLGELETDHTRSELESLFLKLCRRHRLPEPEVNARLGPFLIDFLWRTERLAVELDGYAAHSGSVSFEEDRRRDVWLTMNGYRVVRFTYERIAREPAGVAAAVRALLSGT